MNRTVFGRTNQTFPPLWLQLPAGAQAMEIASRAGDYAQETGAVLDVTAGTALLGQGLRNRGVQIMRRGGASVSLAVDEKHASDLIQAELIETLSSLGRETLDFYFLSIREPLEEVQINGALEALEMARQEGHLRFIGLDVAGAALSALGIWQFHDAFEAICIPVMGEDRSAYEMLAPLAASRRVGVLMRTVERVALPGPGIELRRVQSMEDIPVGVSA